MSEMVERVARSLFQRDVQEDVCDGTWEENPALHERILADARAAIEAMREPTEAMSMALPYINFSPIDARFAWRAMVSEALK